MSPVTNANIGDRKTWFQVIIDNARDRETLFLVIHENSGERKQKVFSHEL